MCFVYYLRLHVMERHGYISNVRDPFERRVDVCEVRPEFLYRNLFQNKNRSSVCVCYMIVAIKPMYFVMYKIIYFVERRILGNHNIIILNICTNTTTCIHPPHEIFLFFKVFKVQCKLNLICGNRKVPVKFQLWPLQINSHGLCANM